MILSEYKSNLNGRILISILAGLTIAILLSNFIFVKGGLIIWIIICIIAIPAILAAYVLSNKLVVQITQDDIQFIRFRKPIEYIPFENNEFTTYTYTLRVQLVLTSTTRYLRVFHCSGQVTDYSCSGLSKKDFETFISEVISISKEKQLRILTEKIKESISGASQSAGVENTTEGVTSTFSGVMEDPKVPFGGADFYFPKEEFRAVIYKKFKTDLIIAGSVTVWISIMNPIFFSYLATKNVETFIRELWFAGIFLFVFGVVGLLLWLQYQTQVKKTPDYIRITENELLIDDYKFFLSDIQLIKMSQERFIPEKKNRLRTLKIVITGEKKQYLLGHMIIGKRRIFYNDYGRLCSSLNDFLNRDNRFVVYETT